MTRLDDAVARKKIQAAIGRKKGNEMSAIEETAIMQGPFESAAIGMGRGLKNISDALGFTETSDFERAAYKALDKESPIAAGGGEIVGEALPFLPAGVATGGIKAAVPRVAAATGVGGAEGALSTRGRGGNEGEQITSGVLGGAITGTAEAVYPVFSRVVKSLYSKLTGVSPTVPVLKQNGKPTAEFQKILDDSNVTFDELTDTVESMATAKRGGTPAEVERKAFFESEGLTPTKAQVTRDTSDFQAQQEALKSSNKVQTALAVQEGQLVSKFDNAITGTGGGLQPSSSSAIDYVTGRSLAQDKEISGLYKVARERAAESGDQVRLVKLKNLLGKSKSDDSITGGVINSTIGDLESKGVIKGDSLNSISVEDAEKIRMRLNQLYNSTTDYGRVKIAELKQAIDDDVFSQAGSDIFDTARTSKSKFEKDLSKARINKFDRNSKSLVRDMLENKIQPEDFVDKALFSKSYRADDLNSLRKYFKSGTPDQIKAGDAAWRDLRSEALEKIRDSAFTGPVDKIGNQALSAAGLKKALTRLGKPKINILFSPSEQKFLKNMTRLSVLRQPVARTDQGLGPSAQAVSALIKGAQSHPILRGVMGAITMDRQGRIVLNATPSSGIAKEMSRLERDIVSGTAIASVPAITSASDKEADKETPSQIYNRILKEIKSR